MKKILFTTSGAPNNGIMINDSSILVVREVCGDEVSYLAAISNETEGTNCFLRRVENLNPEQLETTDLVVMDIETHTALLSYEFARKFKAAGTKVVFYGVHATALPEEAKQHADSVIIGEPKSIWQSVMEDFNSGNLKSEYKADENFVLDELTSEPHKFDLIKKEFPSVSRAIRTCTGAIYNPLTSTESVLYGKNKRYRSIEKVVEDICNTGNQSIYISDPVFGQNPEYALQLLYKLREIGIRTTANLSPDFAKHQDLMKLVNNQIFNITFLKIGSLNAENVGRTDNFSIDDCISIIHEFHARGVTMIPILQIGYDLDTEETFDQILQLVDKSNARRAVVTIATPLPGTEWYNKLKAENRLLDKSWDEYNTRNIVFQPKNFSIEELEQRYFKMMKKVVPTAFRRAVIFANS